MYALQIVAGVTGAGLVLRYWHYLGLRQNGYTFSSALVVAYCICAPICDVDAIDAAIVGGGVVAGVIDTVKLRKIMTLAGAVLLLLLRDDCTSHVGKVYLVAAMVPAALGGVWSTRAEAQTSAGVM